MLHPVADAEQLAQHLTDPGWQRSGTRVVASLRNILLAPNPIALEEPRWKSVRRLGSDIFIHGVFGSGRVG